MNNEDRARFYVDAHLRENTAHLRDELIAEVLSATAGQSGPSFYRTASMTVLHGMRRRISKIPT